MLKIKKIILGIISILFLLFMVYPIYTLLQHRYFFTMNNTEFTVWNTVKGVYIIPGKYEKKIIPKKNYIRTSSRVELILFIDEQGIYKIFNHNCYGPIEADVTLENIEFEVFPYVDNLSNYSNMEPFENRVDVCYFRYDAVDNYGTVREKNNSKEKVVLERDIKWIRQRFLLGIISFNRDKRNFGS